MSESNNNVPMRITQLEEATEYPEGAFYPIAKAGCGTKKIDVNKANPPLIEVYNALDRTEKISLNLFHGEFEVDKLWNCWTSSVYIQTQENYKCGEFELPEDAEYISTNSYWFTNSFTAFCDNSNNKIDLVKNCVDSQKEGFVYSIPEGATKVRFSFNYADETLSEAERVWGIVIVATDEDMRLHSINDYPYNNTFYYYADNLRLKTQNDVQIKDVIGKKTFYVNSRTSGDFNKITDAIKYINDNNIMDATIYIGQGEWDIISELGSSYMDNVSSNPSTWGVVLKNRVHLIGSANSVIIAKYTGSNTNVKEYFSVFNAGKYGFTLENINIKDDGLRYSIHDDRGTDSHNEQYINKYINCKMKHTNGKYGDCIGGGIGINGLIEIRNCYFEGDPSVGRLVYYHGNNFITETNAQCKIIFTGNFLAGVGTFGVTKYGDSEKMTTAYVSNNSVGSPLFVNSGSYAPQDNMEMIEWNNIVRS